MGFRRISKAVLLLAAVCELGCVEEAKEASARTARKQALAEPLAEARASGAFAGTAMTLLNTMANKKVKGIDVALAKRKIYRMRYKVVALRDDAPELTKSDLMIYKKLTDTALGALYQLMKDADPQQQKFTTVTFDRICKGYTFVVCGEGEVFGFTIRPSESGLPGADMYVVTPQAVLALRDLRLEIDGRVPAVKEVTYDMRGNDLRITHKMELDGDFEMVSTIGPDRSTMQIALQSPKPITDMYVERIDGKATCVWTGAGKAVQDPKPFVLPAEGKPLSTRFLGIDFSNGLTILQAGDRPATKVQIDPGKGLFALHTRPQRAFWLVPSSKGMAEAEKRWKAALKD